MTAADLRDALVEEYHRAAHEDDCECAARFIADRLDAIIVAARQEATTTLRAEVERLEREVASLAADLAVFTSEPGVLARVGSEHTTYWYNQTRLRDAEVERLRDALAAAQFGTHQLARHPGHPRDCAGSECARWLALATPAPEPKRCGFFIGWRCGEDRDADNHRPLSYGFPVPGYWGSHPFDATPEVIQPASAAPEAPVVDAGLRAENERLRAAMSKADGLAKTAYGCLTDAQPAEGDDDISAAMDALDRIRDVLDLPTPEAWDPRNRGIPEFQPAAPARFFVQSCGCIDPQPDPASPCAHLTFGEDRCMVLPAFGSVPHQERSIGSHPHVPTLCATCHHAIEVTP